MSPEAQRIAIAEACGEINPRFTESGACIASTATTDGIEWGTHGVADYLNDLNAIREACLWAIDNLWDSDQVETFAKYLASRHPHYLFDSDYDTAQIIIRSTAEDWCYAFLKTYNLWNPDA